MMKVEWNETWRMNDRPLAAKQAAPFNLISSTLSFLFKRNEKLNEIEDWFGEGRLLSSFFILQSTFINSTNPFNKTKLF